MLGLAQVLISTAHFLAIDVALAAPFVCCWLEWRATNRQDRAADMVARRLARDAVIALVVGSLLGAASLGIFWGRYGASYGASLARIAESRYWFAAAEWLFSLLCLSAYAALWNRLARRRWLHRTLAIVGGTNLAYHFPVLFAVVSVVTADPSHDAAPVDFRHMILAREVLAHVAHDVLAAFVVTGIYVMGLSFGASYRADEAGAQRVAAWGARIALLPALAQFPVGFWLWTTLPARSSAALLMGDSLATAAFATALVGAVGLLHHLATAALGDASRRQVFAAVALVVIVVLAMATARYRARLPFFDPRPGPTSGVSHLAL